MATVEIVPPEKTPAQQAPPKETKFQSLMDHVKVFFGIALKDVITYTPPAASLADVLFPEFSPEIDSSAAILEGSAVLIQNIVITIEQKYSDAPKNEDTRQQKMRDAISLASPILLPVLATLKGTTPVTLDSLSNKISLMVSVLNNRQVPVQTASLLGT